MKIRSFGRLIVLCCMVTCAGTSHGFWGGILEAITKSITDAAAGQATRFEQLEQIRKQHAQLQTAKDQLAYLVQHSERYSGNNAWRASVLIRKLDDQLKQIHANGRHITANTHDAATRMLAVLPSDADFNAARTAEQRSEFEIQQDRASRDALRDSLRATMNASRAFHEQMTDAATNVDLINQNLSRTDSQLAALQLIGAATTQNAQQLQTLTQAVVAQTDLLLNVYARELAAQDRRRGGGETAPRVKIVPSHLVDEYRRRGHDVQPSTVDGLLTGRRR